MTAPKLVAEVSSEANLVNITSTGSKPEKGESSGCLPSAGPRLLEYLTVGGLGLLLMGTKNPPWYMAGAVVVTALAVTLPTTDADCAGTTITAYNEVGGVAIHNGSWTAKVFCGEVNGKEAISEIVQVGTVYRCPWEGQYERVYSDPTNDQQCEASSPATVAVQADQADANVWKIGTNPKQQVYSPGESPDQPGIGALWPSQLPIEQQWLNNISFGGAGFSQLGMMVDKAGHWSKLVPVAAALPDGKICKFTYLCSSGDCLPQKSTGCGAVGPGGDSCAGRANSTGTETQPNTSCGKPCNSFQCTAVCVNDNCAAPKSCSDASVNGTDTCTKAWPSFNYCSCDAGEFGCNPSMSGAGRESLTTAAVLIPTVFIVTGWLL